MPFVKDDKVSVEQHVAAVAKELGTPVTVKGYIRFEKGEGIEKRPGRPRRRGRQDGQRLIIFISTTGRDRLCPGGFFMKK